MQKFLLTTIGSAALAATMAITPASAQVTKPQTAAPLTQLSQSNGVTLVAKQKRRRAWQGRRHWRGPRHGYRRHGWRHRHWRHRHGWGPAVGAGIAGLVIGGALAAQAQASADAIEWCDRRYRSYDRRTRTYLGYDGYRHSCP